MIQGLLNSQEWVDVRTWRTNYGKSLSPVQLSVLSVVTPLTRLLEGKYNMRLDVYLHDQFVDELSDVEAELLKVKKNTRCLRRKVSLLSRGEVMFDAESALPLEALPLELIEKLEEGKDPLANLLSDQGLSLSRFNLNIALIEDGGFYDKCWARRSVLESSMGAKALVVEVFHDALWRKLNYLVQR